MEVNSIITKEMGEKLMNFMKEQLGEKKGEIGTIKILSSIANQFSKEKQILEIKITPETLGKLSSNVLEIFYGNLKNEFELKNLFIQILDLIGVSDFIGFELEVI